MQALAAEFPPARMVAQWDAAWERLHAVGAAGPASAGGAMPEGEARYYAQEWLADNTPYDPKTSAARQAQRAQRERLSWARNLGLIALQAALQLPSIMSLVWLDASAKSGGIQYQPQDTWGDVATSRTAVFFYAYAGAPWGGAAAGVQIGGRPGRGWVPRAVCHQPTSPRNAPAAPLLRAAGSALVFQALGILLRPLNYMRLAAALNLVAVLAFTWAVFAPTVRQCCMLWPRTAAVLLHRCKRCWLLFRRQVARMRPPSTAPLSPHALQIAAPVFYLNAALAATWPTITSFVFLDFSRVSVSQHGPAVMGFAGTHIRPGARWLHTAPAHTNALPHIWFPPMPAPHPGPPRARPADVLHRAMAVIAAASVLQSQGMDGAAPFEAAAAILLCLAVWFALWLLRQAPLPPHFRHWRLRLRGQLALLLRHRR